MTMNEKNFDSISQFEVPKSWIDGALDVPASHTKKPFPLIKLTRTFAAVACFILVCGISVALYFITDDSSIPPVKSPDSTNSQFVSDSYYTGESDTDSPQNNKKPNKNTDKNVSENPTSSALLPDENKNNSDSGSHPEPNEKPAKPQEPTTNKPQKPDTTDSTQSPTNVYPSTRPQNPPLSPSEPEWEPPTEEYISPSEVYPGDPMGPPVYPTARPTWVSPTEDPTEPHAPSEKPQPTDPYNNVEVFSWIGANRVAAAKTVYCALYDSNDRLLGSSNLFASSHIASKGPTTDGRTYVYYYPYRNIDIPKDGAYTYVFYNEKGEEMIRNTCYLKSNL